MAVSMADITKLRKMTGAGMMDCKNALTEAEGDFDKAMEIIRKKGQAVAAKRSDREASEGCVLAKTTGDFAAIIALKCETDFVAQNADFVKLTQAILDLAVANKCKTLDEVKNLPMGNATVQVAVTDRSGITGEKMELDGYMTVEGPATVVYNHMNRNGLCTIAAFNKATDEQLMKQVAMQIAAMNPIAIDEEGVPQAVKDQEIAVAVEKTKAEQVQKAVEVALKKAGINPAHVDSEDHMESNMAKGWISAEDVARAKEIIAKVSEEKAANLPEQMIQNIAKGRLGKFLKEVCLLNQEDIMDGKKTVREVLKAADPELQIIDFKRFTLRAE
ncbi:MAG: translation elongation factor Ts [Bacteroides sp.]